jgi:hypothetical protein
MDQRMVLSRVTRLDSLLVLRKEIVLETSLVVSLDCLREVQWDAKSGW